jgi:undecaprenyl-diphosphatase
MSILVVVLLGVVQGITEFLPVSSSGHLALLETLFGFDAKSPEMLLFDLATHLGTLIAIGIVFGRLLPGFVPREATLVEERSGLGEVLAGVNKRRLLLMIIAATAATGMLAMPVRKYLEQAFGSLEVVALMWVITGTLLWVTDRKKHSPLDLDKFGLRGALVVGLAQGVAVMPGISRSGATICIAILLGLQRTGAVAFSLLIGIPAILGAALVESLHEWEVLKSGSLPLWCALLGGAVAAVVGVGAIKLLLRFSQAARLRYFGFYCYALALVVLVYSLMR